jgi:transposase
MAEGKRRKKRFFASGSWQQPRRGRFSSAAGARGGRPDPCKVFVGNISFAASMDELRDVFEEFGPVWHCHIVRDQRTRRSKGFGFVTFGDVDAVERALSASEDKLTLDGRTLRLDRPVSKKKLSARSKGGGSCGLRDGDSSSGVVEEQPQDEGSLPGVAEDPQASMTSRDQQCSPSVPELNDDVLFLVMTHLSLKDRIRVERVSKRWRCVAKASWRRIHHISFENCFQSFSGKYGGLCDSILQSVLVRGGKSAVSLDLSCTPKSISESGLALIGQSNSNCVFLPTVVQMLTPPSSAALASTHALRASPSSTECNRCVVQN